MADLIISIPDVVVPRILLALKIKDTAQLSAVIKDWLKASVRSYETAKEANLARETKEASVDAEIW